MLVSVCSLINTDYLCEIIKRIVKFFCVSGKKDEAQHSGIKPSLVESALTSGPTVCKQLRLDSLSKLNTHQGAGGGVVCSYPTTSSC